MSIVFDFAHIAARMNRKPEPVKVEVERYPGSPHVLTIAQMPPHHTHTITDPGHSHSVTTSNVLPHSHSWITGHAVGGYALDWAATGNVDWDGWSIYASDKA